MAEVAWTGVVVCGCGKTAHIRLTGEMTEPGSNAVTNIEAGTPCDWVREDRTFQDGGGDTVELKCKECWDPE